MVKGNITCPFCHRFLREKFIMNNCVCICGFEMDNGLLVKIFYKTNVLPVYKIRKKLYVKYLNILLKTAYFYHTEKKPFGLKIIYPEVMI